MRQGRGRSIRPKGSPGRAVRVRTRPVGEHVFRAAEPLRAGKRTTYLTRSVQAGAPTPERRLMEQRGGTS
jgi:hypothetical protein